MRCNVTVSANAFIVPACLIRVITATNRNIALSRSEIFFFYIKDFLYIRVLFLTYFFVLCVSGKRHNIVLIKFFFCKKIVAECCSGCDLGLDSLLVLLLLQK